MKMLSLILAVAFAVALPSLAGRPDGRLPGVGTFSYNAAPSGLDIPQRIAALSRQQAGVNN